MKIVGISGSLRASSSNAALLRVAADVAPPGLALVLYQGLGGLPHFNPDLDGEGQAPPEPVRELRDLLLGADGVLLAAPEYAHGVPGLVKNGLDWLVSVAALVNTPIAAVTASASDGERVLGSLIQTLRAMTWNVLPEACWGARSVRKLLEQGEAGLRADAEIVSRLQATLGALAEAARRRG